MGNIINCMRGKMDTIISVDSDSDSNRNKTDNDSLSELVSIITIFSRDNISELKI